MKNKIIDALKWRAAIKKFDTSKKIPQKDIEAIEELLILTPSAYGIQPWAFVFVHDENKRKALKVASWNQDQIVDASHLLVICIPTDVDEAYVESYVKSVSEIRGVTMESLEGYKNMMIKTIANMSEGEQRYWAREQVCIALGNLTTSLALMGIDMCPMAGFEIHKYDDILGLSEMGLEACMVCPMGYRSEEDNYVKMKKVRFSKEEMIINI